MREAGLSVGDALLNQGVLLTVWVSECYVIAMTHKNSMKLLYASLHTRSFEQIDNLGYIHLRP